MDLYIYYRVLVSNASLVTQRVLAMQSQLAQQHGITTALKRRPQEKEQLHTWMEVYHQVPEHFEQALSQAVAAADLDDLTVGPRHTEHFLDFSPCA